MAVALLAVVAAISATYSYAFLTKPPASSTTASSVRVFGLVTAQGAGMRPTQVIFIDTVTGRSAVAPVSGNGYSIQLPNHRSYNVSMGWSGNYTWQTGHEALGRMMVDMSEGSMMAQSYNIVQPTPDSEVVVSGTFPWQMVTARPSAVKFTATDGQSFTTYVTGPSFVIGLPNFMTYEVNVAATNATGYVEWYYFHQLEVSAGVNVVGITVRLG